MRRPICSGEASVTESQCAEVRTPPALPIAGSAGPERSPCQDATGVAGVAAPLVGKVRREALLRCADSAADAEAHSSAPPVRRGRTDWTGRGRRRARRVVDPAQQAAAQARRNAGQARAQLRDVLTQQAGTLPPPLSSSLPSHPRLAPDVPTPARGR